MSRNAPPRPARPLAERRTPERFCHVFGRALYRALGIGHAHHRRLGSTAPVWRRPLALDYLLDHPGATWLPTTRAKVKRFHDRGISLDLVPQRVRGGQTLRYFTLNPAVVETSGEAAVTFVFTDPGHGTDRALRFGAREHSLLWDTLRSRGAAVHVAVAVRAFLAGERYDATPGGWTAGGDSLVSRTARCGSASPPRRRGTATASDARPRADCPSGRRRKRADAPPELPPGIARSPGGLTRAVPAAATGSVD